MTDLSPNEAMPDPELGPAIRAALAMPHDGAFVTRVLFELHTGELLGPAGTLITLVTGVGLLGLALSGVAMASARWRRRRR